MYVCSSMSYNNIYDCIAQLSSIKLTSAAAGQTQLTLALNLKCVQLVIVSEICMQLPTRKHKYISIYKSVSTYIIFVCMCSVL